MLIGGLPAVPEPSIVALGLGASTLLAVRRRPRRC